ncbi:MAG: NAD-dependent DNA ligase LigA [Lachnospiraceae bacterium]|nr:NAD-dependent DNA ligase LigA [Lachnospiraceae bacterium]
MGEKETKEQRMDELIRILNEASEAYYNGQDEAMSNFEWDALFDELKALEEESGIVRANSPTANTGAEAKGSSREPHEFPALSLAKTKSVEELKKWAGDREIWLSWKLDGLTLVATYDGGHLSKLLTRGNGTVGNNITFLGPAINELPERVDYEGHLVVRGEAVISYPDFELINETAEDGEKYANPRNLASGTLNLDDAEKVKERHISFRAFTLVYIPEPLSSWGKRMELLSRLGFKVVEREKTDASSLEEVIKRWTKRIENGEMIYPADGLVLCYEDNDYASSGSVTGHHQLSAGYAFKWEDTAAETVLKEIEWSCAVSTISPVAVFEPVNLEGTVVSRASLCNISECERLGIGGKGSVLSCIKANKIIPKIIGVKEAKGVFEVPSSCPVCHAKTEIRVSLSGTKTLRCTNENCPARNLKRYTRFVSKSGLDIDGLSVETLLTFMNAGLIGEFSDIFRLPEHFDTIMEMEGFGKKSCENLGSAIERSRRADPVNLIFSLCIPMVGTDAAKKLIRSLGFEGFLERLEKHEGFEDLNGVGPERSASILSWYENERFRREFEKLLDELTLIPSGPESPGAPQKLSGMSFVITGNVNIYRNRDEFKAYVESQGGTVTGSVSKKTAFLVNNDTESTSSKNRKAKELGIPIISEEEFVSRFGSGAYEDGGSAADGGTQ